MNGSTVLATSPPLNNGAASFSYTFNTAGTYNLTAVYAGDSQSTGSTSGAKTLVVGTVTSTSMSLPASPILIGQNVTLAASVTGSSPTGSITFYDGSTQLCSGTVSSGSATCTATFSVNGSHSLTAVYGGDVNNGASTSNASTITVAYASNTTLSSSSPDVAANQSFSLTANVTGNSPSGQISFMDGSKTLATAFLNATGTASASVSLTSTGQHNLTAVYGGDSSNATSTSPAATVYVAAASGNTLSGLPLAGSLIVAGQSLTVTDTVSGNNPTGTVTFYDGNTSLGSAAISGGNATLSFSLSSLGSHKIYAVYGGDANNRLSASALWNLTVSPVTSVTLTFSTSAKQSSGQPLLNAGSALSGNNVTFTATVSSASPIGSVTFYDGSKSLGSGSLSNGVATFTTSFTGSGTHSITATYGGDGNNVSATSAVANLNVVNVTTTSVSFGANPVPAGQSTAIGANFSSTGTVTGTVTFYDGSTVLNTVTIVNDGATLNQAFATAGNHSITAQYNGDSKNAPSLSQVASLTVQTNSTAAISISPSHFIQGQVANWNVSVSGNAPTGQIFVYENNVLQTAGTLTVGTGSQPSTFSTQMTVNSPGVHSYTANYNGDTNNAPAISPPFAVTVLAATTASVTASNTQTINTGSPVTLTGQLVGNNPTGNLTFMDGSSTLATVALTNGQATWTGVLSPVGVHPITVVYGGDSYNAPVTSSVLTENVGVLSSTGITLQYPTIAVNGFDRINASVTGNNPTGSITVYDGSTAVGTATVSGGQAVLTPQFQTTGIHNVSAVYSGDANNGPSTSAPAAINVVTTTTTTLSGIPGAPSVGAGFKITATVTGNNPTGTVAFYNTGSGTSGFGVAEVVNGTATLWTYMYAQGSSDFYAVYSGDGNNTGSTSNTLTAAAVVSAQPTMAAYVIPGAASLGDTVSLNVALTNFVKSGTVYFYYLGASNSTLLGTLPYTPGQATQLKVPFQPTVAGQNNFQVLFEDSSGAQTITGTSIMVAGTASNTLTVNPNTVSAGQNTTLMAVLTGDNPAGTVTFLDGGHSIGQATIVNGQAVLTTSFAAGGLHQLVANYGGDAGNGVVNSNVANLTVVAPSTSTVSFNANPAPQGQSVAITANVSSNGAVPTGTVNFTDNGTALGSAQLNTSGTATVTTSYANLGSHSIAVAYGGDTYNKPSTGSSTLAIEPPTTSTVAFGVNPAVTMQPVPITATVNGNNPTGGFTFYDGTSSIGTANLSGNQASVTVPFAVNGSHNITAVYSGDANNAQSTSTAASLTVNAPINWVTSSANPAQATQQIILTGHIIGTNPTGQVDFLDGGSKIGSAMLNNGLAALTIAFPTANTSHSIVAYYEGDANNAPTTTIVPLVETVIQAQPYPTVSLTAPVAGKVYPTLPATVTLQANAASSQGSIAQVNFFNGSNQIGYAATPPYSYDWTNVSPGTYSITAQAVDNVGFITNTVPVNIRVNSPPTVSVTSSPANGAVLSGPPTGITVTASAADSDGSIAKVDIYYQDTLRGPAATLTTSPYVMNWAPKLTPGTYSFTAVATDNDGGTTTSMPTSFTIAASPDCIASTPASGTYTARSAGGSLWGNPSSYYTIDSDIGMAIVQSGEAQPGQTVPVVITPVGLVPSYTGTTQGGITSSDSGSFCGMLVSVTPPPPSFSMTRSPAPMVVGQPFTVSTAGANYTAANYACTDDASGATQDTGNGFKPGSSTTSKALAAWSGTSATCAWSITGPSGSLTYTEHVQTVPVGAAPITFAITANGQSTASVTAPADATASQQNGQPAARVTFAGGVSEVGAGITSVQWSTGIGPSVAASFPMTLPLTDGAVVTFTATDNFGKTASTTFTIHVASNKPQVTLTTANANLFAATGSTVPVTINANATAMVGTLSSMSLQQSTDGGTTYDAVPNASTTGGTGTSLSQAYTVNFAPGSYKFQLVANDSQGNSNTSAALAVTVSATSTSLVGQTGGVRQNAAGDLEVFGWACVGSNSQATAVTYQIYNGTPGTSGVSAIAGASGTANQSDTTDSSSEASAQQNAEQAACGSTGHDFKVDFNQINAQYANASTPLVVQVADGSGHTLNLPCAQGGCTLPGQMRIGIDPRLNGSQFNGNPAKAYIPAIITSGTTSFDAVNIVVNGQSSPAVLDNSVAQGGANGYTYYINPSLTPGTYAAVAEVQKGSVTLYSTEVDFTVVTDSGSGLVLNNAGGNISMPYTLSATVTGTPMSNGSVVFYADDAPVASAAAPVYNDDDGTWTVEWNGAASGKSHTVYAKLFDSGGNLVTKSQSVSFNVAGATGGAGVSAPIGATPQAINVAVPYLDQPTAGSLPGSVSVGNNGAATYSIPIGVPPGTAGLAPQLSLNYSSLAGNGIAGFGWSLGGGSSIHRCIRTSAQDGYPGPINLNSGDALCLDGTRLLLVSGTYGAVGSTYRTEIDNFARIKAVQGLTVGGQQQVAFTVETKDGRTMTYGSTADSAVNVVGKLDQNHNVLSSYPAVLFWDLATVTDRAGNLIAYTYNQDTTTGEHLLKTINYGNNQNKLYNSISFGYECRNGAPATSNCVVASAPNTAPVGDADIEYVAGARADLRHRLNSITTASTDSNGATVPGQVTTLSYQLSGVSSRSLLSTVKLCGADGICLPVTTFGWGQPTGNASFVSTTTPNGAGSATVLTGAPDQDWGASDYKIGSSDVSTRPGTDYQQRIGSLIIGDFMGDGKQRILTADQGEGAIGGVGGTGGGWMQVNNNALATGNTGGWHIYTVKEDKSGFDRIDLPYNDLNPSLPRALDFGVPNRNFVCAGCSVPKPYSPPTGTISGPIMVADFDGDGKADILYLDQDYALDFSVHICLSRMKTDGSGTFDCQTFAIPFGNPTAQTGFANAVTLKYFNAVGEDAPNLPPYQAMMLSTQGNGRSDMLIWNPGDLVGNNASNQRCSYVAPVAGGTWSWSCYAAVDSSGIQTASSPSSTMYPGVYDTMQVALGLSMPMTLNGAVSQAIWPTFTPSVGAKNFSYNITNDNVVSALSQRSYIGDFYGTGQSGFITQHFENITSAQLLANYLAATTQTADTSFYGQYTNSDLFVAVSNPLAGGTAFNTVVGGTPTEYPTSAATNQFIWNSNSGLVQSALNRYLARESKNTEIGGSPLGDINGDGYSDYLMTFEGHAEVCYSMGSDGFDCRLMEDYTPSSGYAAASITLPQVGKRVWNDVSTGLTISANSDGTLGTNGNGVFSLLSTGHVSDTNLTEAIYRAGDGGAYNGGAGGIGGNLYWVCIVRDGLKNCKKWTGPNMRPYVSGADTSGFPIPGVTFVQGSTTVNWPTAGTVVADFTGEGRNQILFYCNSSCAANEGKGWQLYRPNMDGPIDRLVSVTNGNQHVTTVDYERMAEPSVYTQTPIDGTTYGYPLKTMTDGGRMLVSAVHVDNGKGISNTPMTTTYKYEGLVTDQTGRGEQGFERITVTDPLNTVRSTQYAQGFPYTGMELGYKATSATGVLMEQTANTLAVLDNLANCQATSPLYQTRAAFAAGTSTPAFSPTAGCSNILYPYTQQSQQLVHADLNGAPLPTVSSVIPSNVSISGSPLSGINGLNGSNGLDTWGNVLQTNVTTQGVSGAKLASQSGTFTTITTNLYGNHPGDGAYVIGQLTATQVTKSAPGQTTMTRTKQFDYYGQNTSNGAPGCGSLSSAGMSGNVVGLLMDEITEPCSTDPSLKLQTNFGRDGYGNVLTTTQAWNDSSQTGTPLLTRTIKTITYDGLGRFTTGASNALLQTESATFDPISGKQTSHTDVNQLLTTWVIDGFGRAVKEIRPDGTQTGIGYKQCGSACPAIQGVTARNVIVTNHVLASNTSTLIAVPEIAYLDSAGHPLRHQTWGFAGQEVDTDQTYDDLGREWQTYQPAYSGDLQYLSAVKQYDDLNRVTDILTQDEVGTQLDTQTDYNGIVKAVKNPAGQIKQDITDANGQLSQSIDPASQVTTFTRDAFGDLTQTIDPKSNKVTITYDNLGRKTQMLDPDLGMITYGIDARGIQWKQINPIERGLGQSTIFIHDALDRMTERVEPGLDSHWVYDNLGSPTACGTANGTSCGKLIEAYTWLAGSSTKDYRRVESYDGFGRPSTTTQIISGLTTTGRLSCYDSWGRPSTVAYLATGALSANVCNDLASLSSNAKAYSYYYNNYGGMAQIARTVTTNIATTNVLWEAKKQDATDKVLFAALGNGLSISREYNTYTERQDDGLITNATGALVFHENYQYDILGNVSNRALEWGDATASNYSEAFTYDILNRLVTSQVFNQIQQSGNNGNSGIQSYGYDSIGNIICKTGVGTLSGTCSSSATGNYTYGAAGSGAGGPHAVTNIAGIGNFIYDADGNMIGGAGRSFSAWTSFDMPATISGPGGSSTFSYGPEHQRSRQVRSDITMYYVDGMEIDVPLKGNGTGTMAAATIKTYWPAGLGEDIDIPATATQQRWDHDDRLGSVAAITDENGNLIERMAFDAWGNRRDLVGDAGVVTVDGTNTLQGEKLIDKKGFTGQEELDQLGLVHLNGRIYDPFTGRFLSADPMIQDPTHTQSYNRYTYVWNNPTNLTDPTGFEAEKSTQQNSTNSTGEDGKSPLAKAIEKAKEKKGKVVITDENGGVLVVSYETGNLKLFVGKGDALREVHLPSEHRTVVDSAKDSVTGTFKGFYLGAVGGLPGMPEVDLSPGELLSAHYGKALGEVAGLETGGAEVQEAKSIFQEGKSLLNDCKCFVAGTLVQTREGLKPIEKIRIGTLVLAREVDTGAIAWKPVLRLIRNGEKDIIRLTYLSNEGAIETLGVTPEHPFMTPETGWVPAGKLQLGDKILRLDGQTLTVEKLVKVLVRHNTYNLEIADFHTYFVGRQGIWVHNSACDIVWKGFDKGSLSSHFVKHGKEFGDITQNEYLALAKKFASETGNFVEQKISNIIVKVDLNDGRVFVGNVKDRAIRTFYRAEGSAQKALDEAIQYAKNITGGK